jgi:hypothetical protein
MKERWESPSE